MRCSRGRRSRSHGLLSSCGAERRSLWPGMQVPHDQREQRFMMKKTWGSLNGDYFKKSLQLLNTASPVVPIVSQLAVGTAQAIGSRNKNVGVRDFFMGLDFVGPKTGARLAQGSYITVQAADDGWNWSDWCFDKAKVQVVSKTNGVAVPYNYVISGLTKM